MSAFNDEFIQHDYTALDQHFEQLNERSKTRTGWLRAATFWSYAKSASLLIAATGVFVCLLLLGVSFVMSDSGTKLHTSRVITVERPADVSRAGIATAAALTTEASLGPTIAVAEESASVVRVGEIKASDVETGQVLEPEPEPSEPLTGVKDPGVPMVYDFTKFDSVDVDLYGFDSVVTGRGFELSTSTEPAMQWCYAQKGTPPVSARVDLAVVFEHDLREVPLADIQNAKLSLTDSEFEDLRKHCNFS